MWEQRKAGPGVTHARGNRTNLTSTAGQRRESVTQTWSPGRCSDLRLVPVLLIRWHWTRNVPECITKLRGPETSSADYLRRHHLRILSLVSACGALRAVNHSVQTWNPTDEHNTNPTILYANFSCESQVYYNTGGLNHASCLFGVILIPYHEAW